MKRIKGFIVLKVKVVYNDGEEFVFEKKDEFYEKFLGYTVEEIQQFYYNDLLISTSTFNGLKGYNYFIPNNSIKKISIEGIAFENLNIIDGVVVMKRGEY